jgi:very-short-patch-repair endonuclease
MAEAVAIVAPRETVFGDRTAVALWQARGFAGPDDPVDVILPPGIRWHPAPGVRVRWATTAGDVVSDGRLRWTSRTRTALDLIRRGPLDDAVALLDRLVRARVVDLETVRTAAHTLPRGRGSRQAREVARLADGLAESPRETRLRLLLHRSGLPQPVAQFRVVHDGRFVAKVDFAYPEARLAIEYDGEWHGEPGQLHRDRQRMNRLLGARWRILFFTAADLYAPEGLLDRIAAEIAAGVITSR